MRNWGRHGGGGHFHARWQVATASGTVVTTLARLGNTVATASGAVAMAGGTVAIHGGAKGSSLGRAYGPQ